MREFSEPQRRAMKGAGVLSRPAKFTNAKVPPPAVSPSYMALEVLLTYGNSNYAVNKQEKPQTDISLCSVAIYNLQRNYHSKKYTTTNLTYYGI